MLSNHEAPSSHLYIGLSDIDVGSERIEFARGISIEPIFAHLMSPMLLAFERPAPGKHHPGPWKSIAGGSGRDITAQISIPVTAGKNQEDCLVIGAAIVSLLRLRCDPGVTMTAASELPFEKLRNVKENAVSVVPLEVMPRHFPLKNGNDERAAQTIGWVSTNFETAMTLRKLHQNFAIASDALDSAQFIPNNALALISLWGALEALFSPGTSELRFRVSALIAAYLHAPGDQRLDAQKRIAVLYDKRSAAAHGKPRHVPDDLVDSFLLLRTCLMKMIKEGYVPTKEQLESNLFGKT